MVMQLLQPAWLWGLLGLLVPIAIHLLHKRSRRVVLVGSLQAFRGGAPVQASSIRLNEVGLLLLRCLLLALFVLLLAQPVILDKEDASKRYVFIAPALASQQKVDSLQAAGFSVRLLQPGLPLAAEGVARDTSAYNYWDVFNEIDGLSDAGDTVKILFHPTLVRFRGTRPSLTKTFLALPAGDTARNLQLATVLQQPNETLLLQWWEWLEGTWKLRSKTIPQSEAQKELAAFSTNVTIQQPDTLTLAIQADTAAQAEARMWQQGLQIIDSLLPSQFLNARILPPGIAFSPDTVDAWVWLSAANPPASFNQQQQQLRFRYDEKGSGEQWFIRDPQDMRLYTIQHTLSGKLNDRVLLTNFISELLQVLPISTSVDTPPVLLAESQWQGRPASTAVTPKQEQLFSLEWILGISLFLIFILERWLSLRN